MRTVYTILCTILLAAILFVGATSLLDEDATFSHSENRALKTAPEFNAESFVKGEWFEGYLAYYRDTFPSREKLLENNQTLGRFYHFSALADEEDVQIVINLNSSAAQGGEALKQEQTPATAVPTQTAAATETIEPTEATETTQSAEPTETTEELPEITEPEAAAEDLGAAILVGNRAMDVPYLNENAITIYADAVNAIAEALGVRTFCIDVPNAAAFYAPKAYRTGACDQKAMIDLCYSKLSDKVICVDAYTTLAKHADEYIYFRTDHHWTQLGSYYAYTAFCEAAGLSAQPLEKFKSGRYLRFVGSMRTYLSGYWQASILSEEPDYLKYYLPYADSTATYYYDASLQWGYATAVVGAINESTSNKYLTYLGGDHPVTVIETDAEGPVCLILKESYGNAFVPWLTSHYSKIIAIDPREFNRDGKPSMDLVAFAKENGVDECIVLDYPILLNSPYYAAWLGRMVK